MADVKVVKGTLANGAVVSTSEENAARLGAQFTPEGQKARKATAAKADDAKQSE